MKNPLIIRLVNLFHNTPLMVQFLVQLLWLSCSLFIYWSAKTRLLSSTSSDEKTEGRPILFHGPLDSWGSSTAGLFFLHVDIDSIREWKYRLVLVPWDYKVDLVWQQQYLWMWCNKSDHFYLKCKCYLTVFYSQNLFAFTKIYILKAYKYKYKP